MSLSMSREADLGTAKSGNASSIVIICLVAMVVALCTVNNLFLRASGAVVPSEVSSLVGP
jgi:hypothetical protein